MGDSIRILAVDDDPDVLSATVRMIAKLEHEVVQAKTGEEARAMLKSDPPDLVVLDVMLPDMKGTDLCRDIKSDPALNGVFVVLTSGMKISSLDQADGLEFGADGYIARPISNREFRARINAMVRILMAERERDRLILELETALSKVKQLSGLLPFCSYCKKIRNDNGYWSQIEEYLQEYSDAELGDSICPNCAKSFFPGVNIYRE